MEGSPWRAVIESLFKIVNKQGETVPMKLNRYQAELDSSLTGRDIIPKARQLGVSSYFIARFVAKCLTQPNRRCVIVSHEEKATRRLLAKARFIIDNLDAGEGIKLEVNTDQLTQAEIVFKDTGSWFYIGTAQASAFGRGDTITDLHCSEFAFWPNPGEFAPGLFSAVPQTPGGEIFIESSGNGFGDDFSKRSLDAAHGRSSWKLHFLPWHLNDEYATADNSKLVLDDSLDEARLVRDFGLSAAQLRWRRDRIDDAGGILRTFQTEFPITMDECFLKREGSVFQDVTYEPGGEWIEKLAGKFGGFSHLPRHPLPGRHYVLGVDTSAGVGRDNSVIQVGCLETSEQVAVWWGGRTAPNRLAGEIEDLARKYNTAYVVVESNNHGLVVLDNLRKIYPISLIHKFRFADSRKRDEGLGDLGFMTTRKSKPLAVGRCVALCQEGFIIRDPQTYMEMQSFVEHDSGKLAAVDGAHDDFVMALVMMGAGWTKASLRANVDMSAVPDLSPSIPAADAHSVDYILYRCRGGGFWPIESGVRP